MKKYQKKMIMAVCLCLFFCLTANYALAASLNCWYSNVTDGCYYPGDMKVRVVDLMTNTLSASTLNSYVDHGVGEWSDDFSISRVNSSETVPIYFGDQTYISNKYSSLGFGTYGTSILARTPMTSSLHSHDMHRFQPSP